MDQQNSSATLTRREVFHRVTLLLGGAALIDGDQLLAYSFDSEALTTAMAQGTGTFTPADVALLDEIAETILPETTTPGAKSAKTGAFMALMVTDTYTDRNQQVFRDGLKQVDALCHSANGVTFSAATSAQRLALLESLDREQKAAMDRRQGEPASRTPAPAPASDEPAHYFRMMKELALLGFFTSEAGCTKALRYLETPGRFDPCATHSPGDKSWAAHA